MRFESARKARDVINDNDVRLFARLQKCDHRFHRRAIDERARGIVFENLYDFQSAIFCELLTTRALAFKAIAFA